jgi:O-methyltransferase involved in polyketide biosynthesis
MKNLRIYWKIAKLTYFKFVHNCLKAADMLDIKNLLDGGLEETLLIPLWCRASANQLGLDFFSDLQALEIVEQIDYDFSGIAAAFQQYGQICCLARAKNIDLAIVNYLKSHPQATVVNIGAGLDTTFSRVDNGSIYWYDLDLPEVATARRSIFTKNDRSNILAKSMFDLTWLEEVNFSSDRGIFLAAGGVLHYCPPEKIKLLVQAMAEKFPGGSLFFDTTSQTGLKIANRLVKKSGNKEASMLFAAPGTEQLNAWAPKAQVGEVIPFFNAIKQDKKWLFKTKMSMNIASWFSMLKYIRFDFLG